jgi:uncharacterized iron-regulated membrane protein
MKMMIKLYLVSKSIHRYLVLIISALTILMAGTGTMLKYSWMSGALGLNQAMIRFLHNNLSVVFTITLICMMVTGIIMYIFPLLKKRAPTQVGPSEDKPQISPNP